ncbi:MAG: ABC transporter substrate-binding protein [Chloroflexota bacterium]
MNKILNLVGLILVALFVVACGGSAPAEPELVEESAVEVDIAEEPTVEAEAEPEEMAEEETAAQDTEASMTESKPIDTGIEVVEKVSGFPPFNLPTDQLEILDDLGDTVLVRHRFGETEVPKNPQRVFTDAATLPLALTLDLPVVASYTWGGMERTAGWEEKSANILFDEWNNYAYNFEFILEQEPDLILAFSHIIYGEADQQTVYENLSAIAPTIVLYSDPAELWPQATAELAQLFDLSTEQATTFENAGTAIAEACKPIQKFIGDETALLIGTSNVWMHGIGWTDEDHFVPYSSVAHLYYFCGLNPPEGLFDLVGKEAGFTISQELIAQLDADHLFFFSWNNDLNPDDFLNDPLWQSLPAFQNGQVYFYEEPVFAVSYEMTMLALKDTISLITASNDKDK